MLNYRGRRERGLFVASSKNKEQKMILMQVCFLLRKS